MTKRERDDGDGWGGEPTNDVRSPFEEESPFSRQITLTLSAPPLSLPGEAALRGTSRAEPAHSLPTDVAPYDGWTVDRLKRSSLPPSAPPSVRPPRAVERAASSVEAEGDAFALVGRATGAPPALDLVSEMAERFALGDFSGSLRAAELLLGQDPAHETAQHYASESRDKLERLYTSRLDAHGRIPLILVADSEIRWLGLDPQVSSLLSRIDGAADYERVIAASGMPRLSALRALVELVDARVVRLM